jgi:hypothetical protein
MDRLYCYRYFGRTKNVSVTLLPFLRLKKKCISYIVAVTEGAAATEAAATKAAATREDATEQ